MSSDQENFVSLALNGQILLEEIDDFVDKWHEENSDLSLKDHLGMTKEEYSIWIIDENSLPEILAARSQQLPIQEFLNRDTDLKLAARSEGKEKLHEIKEWLRTKDG